MFTPTEILDIAITLEKSTERRYKTANRHTKIPALKDLLEWAAQEEEKHAEFFADLKRRIAIDRVYDAGEEISDDFFKTLLGDAPFSLEDIDFSRINSIQDLLSVFIEFERDTVLFYELLQSFLTDKDASEEIEKIITEEKKHIEKFQAFISAD